MEGAARTARHGLRVVAAALGLASAAAALRPLPGVAADEAMHDFWEALPSVVLEGDVLRLPEGVFFLGDKSLGGALYVRERVYAPLLEEIKRPRRDGSGGGPHVLLTGTPGVGKSRFLLYVLWALVTSPDPPPAILLHRQVELTVGILLYSSALVGWRSTLETGARYVPRNLPALLPGPCRRMYVEFTILHCQYH